jgi:hypothetical protein
MPTETDRAAAVVERSPWRGDLSESRCEGRFHQTHARAQEREEIVGAEKTPPLPIIASRVR